MKPIIRKASKDDLSDIFNLVRELAIFEKEPEAVTCSLEEYRQQFESGLFSAFVATINDRTVGMALFYDTFSTWKGKMLYLEDFYITPEYRNRGLGKDIFTMVLKEARERDCKLIKWQVLDWNIDAIRFYEREGATIEDQWLNGKIIF